ncbi:MAG: hypothetical protein ACRECO_18990 [Xanthobacteraceae bacterium]
MTDRCLSSGLKGYIRRRRIRTIAVVCGLAAVALLTNVSRAAAQTFQVDIYVSVQSVPGEPLMGGYYEGGSVAVPTDAIGADGMVPFDSKFDGADGYKEALEKALGRANDKFKDAGVQFRIRSIIFVPTDHPKLKPHYNAEANEYRFALNDAGQSQLLKDFAEITKDTKDAFTMFVAPITVDGTTELGRAQDFGTVSIVDVGTALRDFDNGSILIHELAHNLGVTKHTDDPINEAVAEQTVTKGPRPNPKLTPEQIATIRKEVESGRHDAMRAPESGAASKTSTAAPKGKTSRTGVTKKKKAKRRSATGMTGRAKTHTKKQQPARRDSTGDLIRFGVGVGGGLLGRDGGRRGHQRNRQQQQHRGKAH